MFASFHVNGPLQIYVHCINHWLILCECWRTSEGNHWEVLPSNLSSFAILQICQWLVDFRHVPRCRNSEKIPTWSMEYKEVNFIEENWYGVYKHSKYRPHYCGSQNSSVCLSLCSGNTDLSGLILNTFQVTHGLSPTVTDEEMEAKGKWVTYSQACICWVLEGGYKLTQSAFRSGSLPLYNISMTSTKMNHT